MTQIALMPVMKPVTQFKRCIGEEKKVAIEGESKETKT